MTENKSERYCERATAVETAPDAAETVSAPLHIDNFGIEIKTMIKNKEIVFIEDDLLIRFNKD